MNRPLWKLAGRLALNGLRFKYLKRTGHPANLKR